MHVSPGLRIGFLGVSHLLRGFWTLYAAVVPFVRGDLGFEPLREGSQSPSLTVPYMTFLSGRLVHWREVLLRGLVVRR